MGARRRFRKLARVREQVARFIVTNAAAVPPPRGSPWPSLSPLGPVTQDRDDWIAVRTQEIVTGNRTFDIALVRSTAEAMLREADGQDAVLADWMRENVGSDKGPENRTAVAFVRDHCTRSLRVINVAEGEWCLVADGRVLARFAAWATTPAETVEAMLADRAACAWQDTPGIVVEGRFESVEIRCPPGGRWIEFERGTAATARYPRGRRWPRAGSASPARSSPRSKASRASARRVEVGASRQTRPWRSGSAEASQRTWR